MGTGKLTSDILPSTFNNVLMEQNKNAWERLPPNTLETIFSFLSHSERSSASTVCKAWAEAYEWPGLWRNPVFRFSKSQYSRNQFNPRYTINRFGRFFRKLTILYKRPVCQSQKFVAKQIADFLHVMSAEGVQITSLRMPKIAILLRTIHYPATDKMTDFLKLQTNLRHVDFTNGRTFMNPGLEILESLAPENVQHLMLQNFFECPFHVSSSQRVMTLLSKFHALCSLSLNYNYLSDQTMACLASNLIGHLEVFSILCKHCGYLTEIVSNDSWTRLKKKCPQMQVHFRLEIKDARTITIINSNILSPAMPLVKMQFSLGSAWNIEYDHPLFGYLADTFPNTLREAEFELEGSYAQGIPLGITELVMRCTILENLSLRLRFSEFGVREIFDRLLNALYIQMMESHTVSLKIIRATFRGQYVTGNSTTRALRRMYDPRFKEIGIILKLKVKK